MVRCYKLAFSLPVSEVGELKSTKEVSHYCNNVLASGRSIFRQIYGLSFLLRVVKTGKGDICPLVCETPEVVALESAGEGTLTCSGKWWRRGAIGGVIVRMLDAVRSGTYRNKRRTFELL